MTWYWYAAKDNEIFLDLDSRARAGYAFQRLRRAIRQQALDVDSVYFYRSQSKNKFHMIVVLRSPMDAMRRTRWAAYMGSDIVRCLYTQERIARGLMWPDILITRREYFRSPDAFCFCAEKHKARRITQNCMVMRGCHGIEAGAVYFAKNKDRKKRDRFRLPVGRQISLTQIARL